MMALASGHGAKTNISQGVDEVSYRLRRTPCASSGITVCGTEDGEPTVGIGSPVNLSQVPVLTFVE